MRTAKKEATVFEDAFERAGVKTAADVFHVACIDALRRCHGAPGRVMSDESFKAALIKYLFSVARDMQATNETAGEDQYQRDAHSSRARSSHPKAGGGQGRFGALMPSARPGLQNGDDGGQRRCDAQTPVAPSSPTPRKGGDQERSATRNCAVPVPSVPRRGPDAMRKTAEIKKLCVLDTLRWNGKPIGDNTAEQALGAADNLSTDIRIVRALCSGVPPTGIIREFVNPQEAEKRARIAREHG